MRFLILLVVLLAPRLCYSDETDTVALRPEVSVDGPDITLADLFSGQLEAGDAIIATAPAPGQSLTLEGRFLQTIARYYQLNWPASSRSSHATITRAAKEIKPEDFIAVLQQALQSTPNVPEKFALDIGDGGSRLHAFLPTDVEAKITIEGLRFDPQSNQFEAQAQIISDHGPLFTAHLSGHLQPVIGLPVFNRTIAKDTTIDQSMLSTIDWPLSKLPANAMTDPNQLIGQMAQRLIKPNQIIRADDVTLTPIIKRGDIVLVSFAQGALHLTARARATENGTINQNIKLVNINSQRPLSGQVKAPGLVVLDSGNAELGE